MAVHPDVYRPRTVHVAADRKLVGRNAATRFGHLSVRKAPAAARVFVIGPTLLQPLMTETWSEAAEYGWTWDDAPSTCEKLYLYECFEDRSQTLVVATVCRTNDANATIMQHKGRRLVTTSEQGNPCSGRVGAWLKILDNGARCLNK